LCAAPQNNSFGPTQPSPGSAARRNPHPTAALGNRNSHFQSGKVQKAKVSLKGALDSLLMALS
jgi:hypothetical protein